MVRFSPRAIDDLSDIWAYTLQAWPERQADTCYNMLMDACQAIALGRAFGRRYDEVSENLPGLRAGRHIIFYRPAGSDIEIIRFLHESMDLESRIE